MRLRLEDASKTASAFEARISALEVKVYGLPDAVGSILARSNAQVNRRIGDVEGNLRSVAVSSKSESAGGIKAVEDARAQLGAEVGRVDSRISALESDCEARIGEIRGEVRTLASGLGPLSERLSRAERDVLAVESTVGSAKRELETALAGARDRMDKTDSGLRAELSSLREENRLSSEEAATDASRVRGRIVSCEERVESLNADLMGSVQSLKDEIQGVRNELKDALRSVLRTAPEPKRSS